jgi:hypothetical protein
MQQYHQRYFFIRLKVRVHIHQQEFEEHHLHLKLDTQLDFLISQLLQLIYQFELRLHL